MVSAGDLLGVFKKDLENLKDNDKYKINALTIVARDHRDVVGVAQGVVDSTIEHVQSIPAEFKLLGLYVIDSIVKNVGTPYRKLYTTGIVDVFVHSFQEIRDERGRLKLYNLRTTWKDIFPNARMYELDIRVREHDPAWPLLASAPETKTSFRSLPNIPKIQPKSESDTCTEKLRVGSRPAPNANAVISESRDPRLNRKRKSSQSLVLPADEFLIDRSGDHKMELVARKQGKQAEATENTKKLPLFGGEDLDMRSQAALGVAPARSSAWSSYIGKHSEVCSRRENKDIDMRFLNSLTPSSTSSAISEAAKSFKIANSSTSTPAVPPITTKNTDPVYESYGETKGTTVNSQFVPTDRDCSLQLSPVTQMTPPKVASRHHPQPFPLHKDPLPDRHYVDSYRDFPRDRPMGPSYIQPPVPIRGPPIRGPIWSVEIDGFPDMVNIGVDPRMLSLVSHPKPPRRITIDGHQFTLLLDRVQPLISIGDRIHAVRFRCEYATVLVDGRCFDIPGTGFTRVAIGSRYFGAYLGGPGHEIIIDGKPHTVPLSSHLTFINVGNHSVGVKFVGTLPKNVNVLPPIPTRLLKWAGQGLFGSPRHLHLAPLNPLKELSRLAEEGFNSRQRLCRVNQQTNNGYEATHLPFTNNTELSNHPNTVHSLTPISVNPSSIVSENAPRPDHNTASTVPQTTVDVHELFQKLVKAGIVPSVEPGKPTEPPELSNYSWEQFKVSYTSETDALYDGHQCGQCGLRFQSDLSPEFAKHLDYHYMKNSNNSQDRRSRNFYQSLQYWLISEMTREGAPQFEPDSPIRDLQEYRCPSYEDPSKNVCAVCYESFEVVWDHEEEEWMLQDAIRVDDKVYHPICQEDAGKEFTIKNEDTSPPVTTATDTVNDQSALKTEVTKSSTPENSLKLESTDENAFTCDDSVSVSVIPGLSPPQASTEESCLESLKSESRAEQANSSPVKSEPCVDPQVSFESISADPLAALKAVLKGNVSSLNFSTNSSANT